jgi:hypothetical protein
MTGADSAREAAREKNGKFGAQEQSAPEVTVSAPAMWQIDVTYNDGGVDTIAFEEDGSLPTPFRSDRLRLTQLLGFKRERFAPGMSLSVADAINETSAAIGMYPSFDTYDGTTNLLGQVTAMTAV